MRLTSSVVVELIRSARASLLVVSFAAYGVPEVVAELRAAADRGVRIDLVLESSAADGGALRGTTGAEAAFTTLRDRAAFWHWPARHRPAVGNSRAALHAKIIAVDQRTALITSAKPDRPGDVAQHRGRGGAPRPRAGTPARRPRHRPDEPGARPAGAADLIRGATRRAACPDQTPTRVRAGPRVGRPGRSTVRWTSRSPGDRGHRGRRRSNRSRFMTLTHAATKSCTNFSFASSLA